jgi:drug/metabolite transporter (DMT)-like permease
MNSLILYLSTILIWGTTWIAIKYQLGEVAPIVSIAHRFALAAVVMLLISLPRWRQLRLSGRDHLFVLLQGLTMFSTNYVFVYASAAQLTSGLIAVMFSTMVILSSLNGALFLRRPIERSVLLGAALGLLGMGAIFLPEFRAAGWSMATAHGLLLCVVGTLFASIGNVIAARNHLQQLPVLACNTWGMCYGSAALYLVALLRGDTLAPAWNTEYLASLLYLSLFGSVLAFWAYVTLIGRIGPDRASYTSLLFPLVALLVSTALEGYVWTPYAVLGLTLVLLGNWVAMRRPRS